MSSGSIHDEFSESTDQIENELVAEVMRRAESPNSRAERPGWLARRGCAEMIARRATRAVRNYVSATGSAGREELRSRSRGRRLKQLCEAEREGVKSDIKTTAGGISFLAFCWTVICAMKFLRWCAERIADIIEERRQNRSLGRL